jgi:hypothetical protein
VRMHVDGLRVHPLPGWLFPASQNQFDGWAEYKILKKDVDFGLRVAGNLTRNPLHFSLLLRL